MVSRFLFLVVIFLSAANAQTGSCMEWTYDDSTESGPSHWGDLCSEYRTCKIGTNQSPSMFSSEVVLPGEQLGLHSLNLTSYGTGISYAINTGHALEFLFHDPVSGEPTAFEEIEFMGITYELVQLHFHVPGEWHIDNQPSAASVHLVHSAKVSNKTVFLVIATLFQEGAPHPDLSMLESAFANTSEPVAFSPRIFISDSPNPDHPYYYHAGSLTTPPCTEGVIWLIQSNPLSMSTEQIQFFQSYFPLGNNRPVQPALTQTPPFFSYGITTPSTTDNDGSSNSLNAGEISAVLILLAVCCFSTGFCMAHILRKVFKKDDPRGPYKPHNDL